MAERYITESSAYLPPQIAKSAYVASLITLMLKKIFFYVLASVTLLALIGYYWLGGFNPVIIEVVNHPERVVIGQPYQGRYGDLKLREIFVKTNQAIQAGTWPAPLVVINRDTVMAEEKEINQLIGVLSTRPDTLSSPHYQADTLPVGRYLRAVVQAQPNAMPQPEAVNEQMRQYAQEHQWTLSNTIVEFYVAYDTLWIEMPIQ